MPNMNHVILAGSLTSEPKMSRSPKTGMASVTMTLAIDRRRKGGKENVAFVPLKALGRLAQVAHAYLHEGAPLLIEGRLRTRTYEKGDVCRYFIEVLVSELQLLPKGSVATGTGFAYEAEVLDDAEAEEIDDSSS